LQTNRRSITYLKSNAEHITVITVLPWNPVSLKTANSDHFLMPDVSESCRILTDPITESDRFRLYKSDRESANPITRVTDYGHRIRSSTTQVRRLYGRKRSNTGRIHAVFHRNPGRCLRPYSYRIVYGVFTAKIRRPYMAVFSSYTAILSPFYHRI
jgi:hypothetical protein